MNALLRDKGGVFFLYGHGGTGKTFIWRTLCAAIRLKGETALCVASSGIKALLISLGRTWHSRFAIPININEDSTCGIKPGIDLIELLNKTKLIIWDEAFMIHKFFFEAFDRSLRDVLRFSNPRSLQQPFGGKVIIFGGDFRQILHVIPKGRREDIIASTINYSYIWNSCKVLKLTTNMTLQVGCGDSNSQEIKEFSDWILRVGDEAVGEPNDGEGIIEIPQDLLIKESNDPITDIVDFAYPSIFEILWNAHYFHERAVLCPTHDVVEYVNQHLLCTIPREEKVYLSSDTLSHSFGHIDEEVYTSDFLNTIRCSSLPNHKLTLKVGVPVMLLRNIDQSSGLCNGTRLVITQLGDRIIEAKHILGTNIGHKVFIARMVLSPSDSRLPFMFQGRQFPIIVYFARTINKSQGQSLSHVALYLPRPVLSHCQLYVAISRLKTMKGLKIVIAHKDGKILNTTTNVVYKEVFQNI